MSENSVRTNGTRLSHLMREVTWTQQVVTFAGRYGRACVWDSGLSWRDRRTRAARTSPKLSDHRQVLMKQPNQKLLSSPAWKRRPGLNALKPTWTIGKEPRICFNAAFPSVGEPTNALFS